MTHNALIKMWLVIVLASATGDIKSAQIQPLHLSVTSTCYSFNEPTNTTATRKPVSTKYIAVSRDVEKFFPMHTRIKLTCGNDVVYATVEDRMHVKWHMKVDVFKTNKKACKVWGVRRNCRLEKVK